MHQLLSTLLSYLLSPFNWIIVLMILGYFIKRKSLKKTTYILCLCLFLIFGNNAFLNWYLAKWQPKPVPINPSLHYSCGIVPGGFASPDAQGNGYFNSSSDRFIQAVKLYKLGEIKHLMISGGNGKINDKDFQEAAWVKGQLITFGIPDSVIFVEDKSNNTKDNAIYSKQILDSLHLKPPFLLITSAFHMPRATLLFNKTGVPVDPFPCNYTAGRGNFMFTDLIPTPSTLLGWETYLKETVAYYWYKYKG
jgi:uncharacterized SAM-binding protein YcdF (DUF218 family)